MNLSRVLPFSAASLLLLGIGCGSSPNTDTTTQTPSAAITIYVVQNDPTTGATSVLELPANGQGNVTPTATLNAPAYTGFTMATVDQSGNIYVAGYVYSPALSFEILEYAAGATGVATPTRTLTNLPDFVWALAVDTAGQIYAEMNAQNSYTGQISVFAAGATGNATPIRQIVGSLTQLGGGSSLAVDSSQNLYVNNELSILVFSPTATGNVTPTRIIYEATGGVTLHGLALDNSGDLFSVSTAQLGSSSAIVEFAPGSSGASVPTRTLEVPSATFGTSVAVDAAGNLYTVDQSSTAKYGVDVFSAGESSNSAPARTITSTAWTTSQTGQIAVR